jgi:transposase
MRFYNRQHRHYCGIDLHVKTMYVCILDAGGHVLVHRNVKSTPQAFLETIAPYRDDLVVAAECMFTWYGLADLCAAQDITFVLGHALAMKAIHGGKAKNDKIDSHKIAALLRGGLLPQAYVYPAAMRSTRTSSAGVSTWCGSAGSCSSTSRTRGPNISSPSSGGAKMGNVHLKWAFSEAAVLFLRHAPGGKKLLVEIEKKHGKGKALSILAHTIGRTVFYLRSRRTVFSMDKFRAA